MFVNFFINYSSLEKIIDYIFQDKLLLQEALTHRSYLNENTSWKLPNNERLEFLGDAVLELAVTEELYNRFPNEAEGYMTALRSALVNYQILAQIAREINLEKFILLSRGEAKDTGRAREVILANALEALIGAIYLDSGYQEPRKFVNKFILKHLAEVIKMGLYKDAKSLLQEKAQADLKVTPFYRVLGERGPEHEKIFRVGVYFGDKLVAEGEGLSKQEAEAEAARQALGLELGIRN